MLQLIEHMRTVIPSKWFHNLTEMRITYVSFLQIRAQFAALGAPLVGDSVYMPAAAARLRSPNLDPFLDRLRAANEDDLELGEEIWKAQHGPEPERAVGLQASVLSWEGEPCIFRAGPPWWRQIWFLTLASVGNSCREKHRQYQADDEFRQQKRIHCCGGISFLNPNKGHVSL